MRISMSNVTCSDDKAYDNLVNYLVRISGFKGLDESMPIVVYADENCDILGFESPRYRIQWVNNAHKLYELIRSENSVDPIPFYDFKNYVLSMSESRIVL